MVATMSSVVGQMIFSLLPPLLVRTPAQLGRILLVQLPPGVLVTAAAGAFLAEKPPSPPSASAEQQGREAAANPEGARPRHFCPSFFFFVFAIFLVSTE